jgi:hypothetical protein
MRLRVAAILTVLLLSSCTHTSDRFFSAFPGGLRDFIPICNAAAQFRDANGRWPARPLDLQPFVTDSKIDLHAIDRAIAFQTTQRGLAIVDIKSAKAPFVLANDSTTTRPVIVSGE